MFVIFVCVIFVVSPFGHSAFQGSMMSAPLSGYNAVFFARADYRDVLARQLNKTMEFFWQPSPSLGDSTGTLGGKLANSYQCPKELNPFVTPVMDDPDMYPLSLSLSLSLFFLLFPLSLLNVRSSSCKL